MSLLIWIGEACTSCALCVLNSWLTRRFMAKWHGRLGWQWKLCEYYKKWYMRAELIRQSGALLFCNTSGAHSSVGGPSTTAFPLCRASVMLRRSLFSEVDTQNKGVRHHEGHTLSTDAYVIIVYRPGSFMVGTSRS